MPRRGAAELLLVRHAPAEHGGRLVGRTDVAACLPGSNELAPLSALLKGCAVVSSPALRCRSTAEALCPGEEIETDFRLWEQDFGAQEGQDFAALPDLGPMSRDALARHCPPGGESFLEMAERATPALEAAADRVRAGSSVVIVAHAGTVRTALGLALDDPALGLAFDVAPLSVTRLACFEGGMSVISANGLPF